MAGESDSSLFSLLLILFAGYWLLRRLGFFQGFVAGFWNGGWNRIFLGTLRTPTGSGCLERVIKLFMVLLAGLLVLGWLSGHR